MLKKCWILFLCINSSLLFAQEEIRKEKAILSFPINFLKNAKMIKPVEPSTEMQFDVWLKLRNQEELSQRTNQIYDPKNSQYRHFLTLPEYNQHFAPTEATIQAILNYFSKQHLRAEVINQRIHVFGPVENVERALKTHINYYRLNNQMIYANDTLPLLEDAIAKDVLAISGLTDASSFHPYAVVLPENMRKEESLVPINIQMKWKSFKPQTTPTTLSLKGFSGENLITTYDLKHIAPIAGKIIDGADQTLVIIVGCGIHSPSRIKANANVYNKANHLPLFTNRNFTIVNSDGSPYESCRTSRETGWETEIALDIEAAHTIAPAANIVLVLSPASRLDTAVSDVVHQLIHQDNRFAGFSHANVVSNSWGADEEASFEAMESVFQLAAAHGINFNFSSGDCGDGSYRSPHCQAHKHKIVQYPASSAYVTAVGGTSTFVDKSWNYAFETVWGTYYKNQLYFGGGGGISKYFGPVDWQEPIAFFTAGGYGLIHNYNKRALPDISMTGDPVTGLEIYDGQWRVVAGTSLSSAVFSGTLTLLNQARALLLNPPLGLAAPYLYLNRAELLSSNALNPITAPHEIISGANLPPPGPATSAFSIFDITFGWDSSLSIAPESQFWNDAVGMGTPNIPQFIEQIAMK